MKRSLTALFTSMALLLMAGQSFALEQRGTPEAAPSLMKNYGVDVPVKTALKSALPPTWKLYVHKSANLPSTVSWTPDDSWVSVMETVGTTTTVSVLVDWERKSVFVRPPEVALEEAATQAEIKQAAVTPLPLLKPASVAAAVETPPPNAPAQPAIAAEEPATATTSLLPSKNTLAKDQPQSVASPTSVAPASESTSQVLSESTSAPEPLERLSVPPSIASVSAAPVASVASASDVKEVAPRPPMEPPRILLDPPANPLASESLDAPAEAPVAIRPLPAPLPTPALAPPATVVAPIAPKTVRIAAESAVVGSTDAFSYTNARAFNKPSVKRVLAAIAVKHGLPFYWGGPDVTLRGPVTLMATSPDEDIALLKKALGPYSRIAIELTSRGLQASANQVAVQLEPTGGTPLIARAGAPEERALPSAQQAIPPASGGTRSQERDAGLASDTTVVQSSGSLRAEQGAAASAAPAVPLAATPPVVTTRLSLTLSANESLESAIRQFATAQGYTLEWNVSGGFEATAPKTYTGDTLTSILAEILPSLGVSADVYTLDKHIVVRPGEPRDR
jgi:hypothetical protein